MTAEEQKHAKAYRDKYRLAKSAKINTIARARKQALAERKQRRLAPEISMVACLEAATDYAKRTWEHQRLDEIDAAAYTWRKRNAALANAIGWASIKVADERPKPQRKTYNSKGRREARKAQNRAAYHARQSRLRAAKEAEARTNAQTKAAEWEATAKEIITEFVRCCADEAWDEAERMQRKYWDAITWAMSWQCRADGGDGEIDVDTIPWPGEGLGLSNDGESRARALRLAWRGARAVHT